MQPSISTSKAFSYIRQGKRKEPGFQPDSDICHKGIASDFHHLFRIPGISNRFDLPHIGEARFTKETLSDPNGMFRQFMMIFYYDKAGHLHASPVIWGTQRRRKYIRDVVV